MYKSLLNFQYFSNIIGVCRQCRSKLIHLDAKSKHVYVASACDEESTQPQVSKDVNSLCEHCLVVEDTRHLLNKWTLVENIWRKISLFLGFEIALKILTLGFYNEINTKATRLNNLLPFICFTIYKYKMECRFIKKICQLWILKLKWKIVFVYNIRFWRKLALYVMKYTLKQAILYKL